MDKESIIKEGGVINDKEVIVALSIFKGFKRDFSYVSGPVTSGKLAYDIFDQYGVKDRHELKEKLGPDSFSKLVKEPNVAKLEEFAKQVSKRSGNIVVNPGNFNVPHWSYAENENQYLAMWEPFVAELCSDVSSIDYWEYSTGAVLEFKRGLEANIANGGERPRLLDESGDVIHPQQGLELVTNAITEIRDRGYTVARLERAYADLKPVVERALKG